MSFLTIRASINLWKGASNMEQGEQQEKILSQAQVLDRVGLRRTAIKTKVKRGEFPAPLRLSPNKLGWLESEVNAWIRQLAESRAA